MNSRIWQVETYRLVIEQRFNHYLEIYLDGSHVKADVIASAFISICFYWAVGLFYTFIDVFEKPKWILKYKIQPTSQVTLRSLGKLIPLVLFNQILGLSTAYQYFRFKYHYIPPSNQVPGLMRLGYEMVMLNLIREILFYYIHRWLHHPLVYRHFHKQHHEWQIPIAIVTVYCHPVEHVLCNVFPVVFGPLVLRSHSLTFYLWQTYVMWLSLTHHCGYRFPLSPSPVFHDFHHQKFSQSFSFDEEYRAAIERNYNRLLGVYFEGDQYKADLVLSIVIIVSSYWLFGALDTLIEVFEWPKWILRYKIQSTSQVNFSNLCRLLPQVLLNQLLGLMLTVLGVELRYLLFVPNNHVPSLIRLIYELAMASVLREIAFYYSHRLLHHPRIYRHIHKQHHEWQSPIAMVAIYCHPIEHLLSNVFPTMLGPLVLQMHGITLYLWELWVIFYSMSHHCGYHLPFFPSPVFHNFHHSRSTGNYGILGFLDWFHGTDKAFRNSIYYNLDRIYITVTPPKDMPQKLE